MASVAERIQNLSVHDDDDKKAQKSTADVIQGTEEALLEHRYCTLGLLSVNSRHPLHEITASKSYLK